MIEQIGKFIAKNAAYVALDCVIPGAGALAKRINKSMSAANFLGAKATPDRIEALTGCDLTEEAGDFVENIFDSFF